MFSRFTFLFKKIDKRYLLLLLTFSNIFKELVCFFFPFVKLGVQNYFFIFNLQTFFYFFLK